jgi:hypothetical protein
VPSASPHPSDWAASGRQRPENSRFQHRLFGTIDPVRDAFDIEAQATITGFNFSNLEKRGIVQLPVVMPEAYTLDFTVERIAGDGSFGIGFSVGENRMMAVVDHQSNNQLQTGLYFINSAGRTAMPDAHAQRLLSPGAPVRLRLKVSPSHAHFMRLIPDEQSQSLTGDHAAAGPHLASHLSTWPVLTEESPTTSTARLGSSEAYYPGAFFIHAYQGSFHVEDVVIRDAAADPVPQPFIAAGSTAERRLAKRIVWRGGHVQVITNASTKTVHRMEDLTGQPWIIGIEKCSGSPRLMISDADLIELAGVGGIRKLDLRDSRVGARALAALSGMEMLESLSLPSVSVEGSALAVLQDLPQLRELQLIGSNLRDEDLVALNRFPQLTRLCLTGCPVTDRGAEIVARTLPRLSHLCLSQTKVTGECLNSVRSLEMLEDLQLNDTRVDDQAIANLPRLPTLTSLALENTDVTAAAVEDLKRNHPGLKVSR